MSTLSCSSDRYSGPSGPGCHDNAWIVTGLDMPALVTSRSGMRQAAAAAAGPDDIIIDPQMLLNEYTPLVTGDDAQVGYSYVLYGAISLPRIGTIMYVVYPMDSDVQYLLAAATLQDLRSEIADIYSHEISLGLYYIVEDDESDIILSTSGGLPILFHTKARYIG